MRKLFVAGEAHQHFVIAAVDLLIQRRFANRCTVEEHVSVRGLRDNFERALTRWAFDVEVDLEHLRLTRVAGHFFDAGLVAFGFHFDDVFTDADVFDINRGLAHVGAINEGVRFGNIGNNPDHAALAIDGGFEFSADFDLLIGNNLNRLFPRQRRSFAHFNDVQAFDYVGNDRWRVVRVLITVDENFGIGHISFDHNGAEVWLGDRFKLWRQRGGLVFFDFNPLRQGFKTVFTNLHQVPAWRGGHNGWGLALTLAIDEYLRAK